MVDLSSNCAGIRSPNPFWLASAPPANSGGQVQRAFDAGWGGAVWKTLGTPIQNVSSRFGTWDYHGQRTIGFNNIELITDRPLETNFREIYDTKKKYPKHAATDNCKSCQLFQGKGGDAYGACPLYAGKVVAANGWCSAWVKKA